MAVTEWKDITVFISSTFNDMHAERDYLVKFVFPELRDWCARRKLRLNDIDLRWGITSSDSQTKRTIGICLRDIDKSRPYFIGFLGQRRGWQPGETDIDEETCREYPQLPEKLSSLSVTELEIEHALLAPLLRMAGEEKIQPESARHAFIFLRDDTFSHLLTPVQKRIYTNWSEAAEGEDPAVSPLVQKADEDLKTFRDRLEERIPGTRHYRAEFDTSVFSPEPGEKGSEEGRGRLVRFESEGQPLKNVLLASMKEAILEDYPDRADEIRETTDQDIRDSYIQRMAAGYIERRSDLDAVTSYLNDGKDVVTGHGVMVLHGPSGSGKTTLLAEIYRRCRKDPDTRVLIRCCGVGNDTTTVYGVFRGLFEEIGIPCPLDIEDLKANISASLAKAGSVKTILLIDALDQIPLGPEILSWLPGVLPDNIWIIASIRSDYLTGGAAEELLAEKGNLLYEIQPFTNDIDKKVLVDGYLKSHLKSLDEEQQKILFRKKGSSNPLYLLAALSELRLVGRFQLIESRLESFGELPEDIFDSMMQRMEEDYLSEGVESVKIVSLLCSLIGVSRYGLLKEELESIFADAFPEEDREELAGRIQIYIRQMRDFLLQFGNFTDFRYFALRHAAGNRYRSMSGESHAKIASYFLKKMGPNYATADERALKESVYHLFCSRPDSAFAFITDIRFLKKKLEICGVSPLIEDFEYAAECSALSEEQREQASEIVSALKKSAYILSRDPSELPGQLALRLNRFGKEQHLNFMESLAKQIERPWLRTVVLNEGNSDYIVFTEGQDRIIALFACEEGILILEKDGSVKILSEEDGSVKRIIRGGGIRAACGCLAEGNLYILDADGIVYSYRILSGMLERSARVTEACPRAAAAGEKNLLVVDVEEGACSVDLKTLQVSAKIHFPGGAECLSTCGDKVFFGCRYGKILECRQDTLEIIRERDPDFGLITAIYADEYSIYAGGDGILVRMGRLDGSFEGKVQGYGNDYICSIFKENNEIYTLNGFQAWKYNTRLGFSSKPEGIFQTVRLAAVKDHQMYFLTSDYRLGCIRVEALTEGTRLLSSSPARGLCLSPDQVLLWNSKEGFQLFNRDSGEEKGFSIQSIEIIKEMITSAAAIPDGFLVGTDSGKLVRIDKNGLLQATLHNRPARDIMDPYYVPVKYLSSRDNSALFIGFHELFMADLTTDTVSKLFRPSSCRWLFLEEDQFYYATDSEIIVCSIPKGKQIRKFEIQKDPWKILFNAGILYVGYQDRILTYEMESGRQIRELYRGSYRDFGIMGKLLAVALADRTVRIYRDGLFLCMLTLDDIPSAITCSDLRSELYVGTYRGSFLKLAVENAEGMAAEKEKPREESVMIESSEESPALQEEKKTDDIKKLRSGREKEEKMDDFTFRILYHQDPFVTGGRIPWKYKPPALGNYKRTSRIFAACTAIILLLSVLGSCVYYRIAASVHPEIFSAKIQGLSTMKRLQIAFHAVILSLPPMLALAHLNHVRENRRYISRNRPAEYCLLPLELWTVGSILYYLTALSVPGDSLWRIKTLQFLWIIPWIVQFIINIWMSHKKQVYYGPDSTYTVTRIWNTFTSFVGVILMAAMLVFVWITRLVSWLTHILKT